MRFLLDTDHVTVIQDGVGVECSNLVGRLSRQADSDVAFSIISFHEQALGAHTYINRARNSAGLVRGYDLMDQVARTFAVLPILPFDADAALIFEQLVSNHLRVATMDLRIAAIALSRDLTLLTRNVGDFGKVPGLRTEDWTR